MDYQYAGNDAAELTGRQIRFPGVYPAVVVDNVDPDAQGRIKVRLTGMDGGGEFEVWARLATMMAGNDRGTWFLPDQDDEVLVAFQGGDTRVPYIIGALWNGRDSPPESMSHNNNIKAIISRNGNKITLDDADGQESVTLETPGGQKLELHDGPGKIIIQDSSGNKVTFTSSGISVDSSARVTINASSVDVTASQLNVNTAVAKFSGTIKADSVVANSVVSSNYTPGAGNIW